MALITIETKINIDDYVTEISDKELIREIKRRAKTADKTIEEFINKENIPLPEDDFDLVVREWFAYKKERRESYKSDRSKKAFITSLKNLSGNNANLARKIIEQSMANNWAGIFELKNISAQQKVSETIYTEF